MYCPKCKYTSFDHLDQCPKCGRDWASERKALNLDWLVPSHWTKSGHEEGNGSSASDFSFSDSAEESRQPSGQGLMNSKDFLDLADSDETAELVYDLSESPSEGPADTTAGRDGSSSPEEIAADDDIVLDFDAFSLDEEGNPPSGPPTSDEQADTASQPAADEGIEDDGFADLQLEGEETESAKASGKPSDEPGSEQGEGDIAELLEDEELELDDILVDLDAEDQGSEDRRTKTPSGSSS